METSKTCTSQTRCPCSCIYNPSLYTHIFSDPLNFSRVTVLYKRGHQTCVIYYRPISFLMVFLKYLGRLCATGKLTFTY
jgi:hypothetical protein